MTLLVALLVVLPAQASSIYVSDIQSELDMDCAPTCMLCHATNSGGGGTVTQAFGQAAMRAGLTGGANSDLLAQVLTDLEASGSDVDGDGTTDISALATGLDPNGGGAFCAADMPTYGCVNTGGRHTSSAGLAALLLAAGAVLVRRFRAAAAS